ncbi:hypothetical protein ACQPZ2_28770 [Nocardia pseudovaccinii]|uniref:hypothetical protein n=1 Tax=Nocardia pseudovaccinii TaxID=189540 RepID=UPI003D947E70
MIAAMVVMACDNSPLVMLMVSLTSLTTLFWLTTEHRHARQSRLCLFDLVMMVILPLLTLPAHLTAEAAPALEEIPGGHQHHHTVVASGSMAAVVALAIWAIGHVVIVRRTRINRLDRSVSLVMIGASAAMLAGLF